MNSFRTIAIAALLSVAATSGFAATVTFTEGTRDLVASAIKLGDTDSDPGAAFDTVGGSGGAISGVFGSGDQVDVHGRIVDAVDNFAFMADTAFNIEFNFGGYFLSDGDDSDLSDNAFVSASGFVSEGFADKSSTFSLLRVTEAGHELVDSFTYGTDLLSGLDNLKNPGTSLIFAAGPGSYVLQIDGSGENADGSGVGLYDLSVISVIPLPAAGFLLLGGLGGLALLRRKG